VAVDPTRVVTGFGFSAASTADQQVAETFLAVRHLADPRLPSVGSPFYSVPYVADKGFEGEENHRRWLDRYAARVVHPSATVVSPGPNGLEGGWPASARSSRRSTISCSTTSGSTGSDLTSGVGCGLGWQREWRYTTSVCGSVSNSDVPAWPLPTCWDGDLNSHQAFKSLRQ
jgi:hypothetical protein